MQVTQAYRFALDLTPGQERALLAHAGAARVAHNWALATVKAVMDQRAAERTYGIPDEHLTRAIGWSLPALRKAWNAAKDDVAPWWPEYSKEAYNTGLDARAHARVANLRRHALRQLTTELAAGYGTIAAEDLNVAGMLRNHRLARRIAHAGFAEIRRQLAYKAQWNGGRLVVADRWYPSSKTCSGCGAVEAKLALPERTYICSACGAVLDRDLNAARNLAALAAKYDTAGSGSVAGRGADQKTSLTRQVAAKRQPGTATADQTGTVPPQGGTSDHMLTKAS